jgi:hypothetical protein
MCCINNFASNFQSVNTFSPRAHSLSPISSINFFLFNLYTYIVQNICGICVDYIFACFFSYAVST